MREFVVDLSSVATLDDFIASFNDGFIRPVGGEWSGNLDAFNDYLYWPNEHSYRLVLRGWDRCSSVLGPSKTWDGRSVLDAVADILRDNPYAIVTFT